MTLQCFLNHPKVMGAKLVIDGKTGPNSQTETALKSFQTRKKVFPADGVWGYQTQSTLTPFEQQVWEGCRKQYEIR
jgi:peptidoglycan hydrolase-like protein with peptidoglycan-binding domain